MSDSGDKRRRANGHGSVYQRKDGRWVAQVNSRDSLGYGKPRWLYANSEEEAWRKLESALPDDKKGLTRLQLDPESPLFHPDNQHVYVLQCVEGGPIKIGLAKNVERRVADIQACCPFPLRVLHVIENGGRDIETRLHRNLASYRLHGEWFKDHFRVYQRVEEMEALRQRALEKMTAV